MINKTLVAKRVCHPVSLPLSSPGGGDFSAARHRGHRANREENGARADGVPRGAHVDEERLPGARPRHLQAARKVQKGKDMFKRVDSLPVAYPACLRVSLIK